MGESHRAEIVSLVFFIFVFMFGDKEMKGFTVAVINMLVPSM